MNLTLNAREKRAGVQASAEDAAAFIAEHYLPHRPTAEDIRAALVVAYLEGRREAC